MRTEPDDSWTDPFDTHPATDERIERLLGRGGTDPRDATVEGGPGDPWSCCRS